VSVAVVEDLRFVLALCSSDVFVTVRESSLVSEKRFVLSVLVFGASACRWVNSSSYRTRCGEESVSSCFCPMFVPSSLKRLDLNLQF
jgi:hypothetical protein